MRLSSGGFQNATADACNAAKRRTAENFSRGGMKHKPFVNETIPSIQKTFVSFFIPIYMTKFKDKHQKEKEDAAYNEFLDSFSKMEPNTADFFRYYIIEGVNRLTAYEMSHELPEFDGKDAAKKRRTYVKKQAHTKAHTTLFIGTKKLFYAYNALKSEGVADILLETNMSIVLAKITKTFYTHPSTGKTIARHPGQIGKNEAIAVTSMSSYKGKTEYRMESKTAASKVVMDLLGLNEPQESNVNITNMPSFDNTGFLFEEESDEQV